MTNTYDPNLTGCVSAGLFGLPFTEKEAKLHVIPVPWNVTTSYGSGCSDGPAAILASSAQVDLYHPDYPDFWKEGIVMTDVDPSIRDTNQQLRLLSAQRIRRLEEGGSVNSPEDIRELETINTGCSTMISSLSSFITAALNKGKIPCLLGGDHSISLAAFNSYAKHYPGLGILQIDAHMDLRDCYQGFTHSHAAVMHHALHNADISAICQVGPRDMCEQEVSTATQHSQKLTCFTGTALSEAVFSGESWKSVCDRIIDRLPTHVYVTFDIDGLCPSLCPNTGTPVPGGLGFSEAIFLIKRLGERGKYLVGFDLAEVAGPAHSIDAIVGCRVLLNLCMYTLLSQKK